MAWLSALPGRAWSAVSPDAFPSPLKFQYLRYTLLDGHNSLLASRLWDEAWNSRSQPRVMCRIVLERGRNGQEAPKGSRDTRFEQLNKSVNFSCCSCLSEYCLSSWRTYTAGEL
jgi:hypothetical protein